MTSSNWGIFSIAFLASTVEWVEAFTVVLAVALTIGWRRAATAGVSGLVTVAMLVIATRGALDLGRDLVWFRIAVGILLLLLGLRWFSKAIARAAGLKRLHDEAETFAATRDGLLQGQSRGAWLVAYKGVVLEGLEVWLIVVTLASRGALFVPAAASVLSLALVGVIGAAIRAPLTRLPENGIKFMVAAALLSFGTFWTLGGMSAGRAWPLGDASLLALFGLYIIGGQTAVRWHRARSGPEVLA